MDNIFKTTWNDKRVTVSIKPSYMMGEFGKARYLKIKVEHGYTISSKFQRGVTFKTNPDVLESAGGLQKYVEKLLDYAIYQEHIRRSRPIVEQLSLF